MNGKPPLIELWFYIDNLFSKNQTMKKNKPNIAITV